MIELLQLPFMQRALWAGIFTGGMAGALGSFTILRQLSFLVMPWGIPRYWELA